MNKQKSVPLNRFLLPILYIVFSLLLEIINFLYLDLKTSSGSTQVFPSQWLFNIGGMLVVAGLIYVVKNKHAMRTIFFVFLVVQTLCNIMNANIYGIFGDMFTVDYFVLDDEAFAAIRWEFIDFTSIVLYLGMIAVIITTVILLYKYNKKEIKMKKASGLIASLAIILALESCGVTLFACQTNAITSAESEVIENNTEYLWESFTFKSEAYKSFGFYGFYLKNIYDLIEGRGKLNETEKEELLKYIEDGKTTEAVLDGSLAGDNLIMILCESNEWFAYDPINTPYVWNLINNEAATFTNFYGHNKTNISEGIALNGNMPKERSLETLVNNYGYEYAYTLPKLFKEQNPDATVNYFHPWKRDFYARDPDYLAAGYGFDNYYSIENYTEDQPEWFGDWVSDADYITYFADQFIPEGDEKFMTAFATISTHGPHTYENPRFAKYYQAFDENFEEYSAWLTETTEEVAIPENEEYYKMLRNYKVAAMDFDKTIETIFSLLEERGHLEDTTVVMFADHNAYYDNFCYEIKGIEKTDYSNTKIHNIPLMIYNSNLEAKNYDMFCNTYDIFPTICELHGLKYNKNLVQGYNLFSEEIKNSFFGSHLGEMFDDKFYSKNIADVTQLVEEYSQEELAEFKQKAENYYQIQKKLELIYAHNLAVKETPTEVVE